MSDSVLKPPPRPIPDALRTRGIRSLTDNLPAGGGIDLAGAFTRVFKEEIERKAGVEARPGKRVGA